MKKCIERINLMSNVGEVSREYLECELCGSMEKVVGFKEKAICYRCICHIKDNI